MNAARGHGHCLSSTKCSTICITTMGVDGEVMRKKKKVHCFFLMSLKYKPSTGMCTKVLVTASG